jgi:hypothetical protein
VTRTLNDEKGEHMRIRHFWHSISDPGMISARMAPAEEYCLPAME